MCNTEGDTYILKYIIIIVQKKYYSDGSPSKAALHRNIRIGSSGNPPNTDTLLSRHRVREYPQQPPCSLLGERGNNASLITSQ